MSSPLNCDNLNSVSSLHMTADCAENKALSSSASSSDSDSDNSFSSDCSSTKKPKIAKNKNNAILKLFSKKSETGAKAKGKGQVVIEDVQTQSKATPPVASDTFLTPPSVISPPIPKQLTELAVSPSVKAVSKSPSTTSLSKTAVTNSSKSYRKKKKSQPKLICKIDLNRLTIVPTGGPWTPPVVTTSQRVYQDKSPLSAGHKQPNRIRSTNQFTDDEMDYKTPTNNRSNNRDFRDPILDKCFGPDNIDSSRNTAPFYFQNSTEPIKTIRNSMYIPRSSPKIDDKTLPPPQSPTAPKAKRDNGIEKGFLHNNNIIININYSSPADDNQNLNRVQNLKRENIIKTEFSNQMHGNGTNILTNNSSSKLGTDEYLADSRKRPATNDLGSFKDKKRRKVASVSVIIEL